MGMWSCEFDQRRSALNRVPRYSLTPLIASSDWKRPRTGSRWSTERGNQLRLWATIVDMLGRSTALTSPRQAPFTVDTCLNFVQAKTLLTSLRKTWLLLFSPLLQLVLRKPFQPDALLHQFILHSSLKSCKFYLISPFFVMEFLDELIMS